jgi:nicotinamide-nucleotide adenylyltransferase
VRALVVGRFQPLHNGHVRLIRLAVEESVDVAVAIGSAAAKPSLRNPFSLEERKAMLGAVFPAVPTFGVPDVHDDTKWVAHCLAITGPVDRVYGNDEHSLSLFDMAHVATVRPGLWDRAAWEATKIRALLAEDDAAWRKAVPKDVVPLLEKWDAPRRMMMLAG